MIFSNFKRFRLIATLFMSTLAHEGLSNQFEEVVTNILEVNKDFQSEKKQLESQLELLRPQLNVHLPELSIEGSTTKRFPDEESRSFSNLEISARTTLLNFGKDSLALKQGKVTQEKIGLQLQKLRQKFFSEISRDIFEMIRARKSLTERRKWLDSRKKIIDKAELRYKGGLLQSEEWIRLSLDFENDQNQFEKDRISLDTLKAKHAISESIFNELDWPWMAKLQSQSGKSGIDSKKVESSLSAKINNVEKQLNELKVSFERKSYYPEISLGLGFSRTYGEDGTTSPINKSAVLSVNLPLFSRFSTESAIASYTKLAASQNDLTEAELVRSRIKLEAALREFNRLSARLIESNSPTKMALEIMEKSRLRFLEGKISANELSTDESRYLSLLDSLLRDYQLVHQDLVTICEESSEEWSTCLKSF
jgi:outer membrane protein TolC